MTANRGGRGKPGLSTYTVLVCFYFLYTVLYNNYLMHSVHSRFLIHRSQLFLFTVLRSSVSYSLYCTQAMLLLWDLEAATLDWLLTLRSLISGSFIFCCLFLEKIIFSPCSQTSPYPPPLMGLQLAELIHCLKLWKSNPSKTPGPSEYLMVTP